MNNFKAILFTIFFSILLIASFSIYKVQNRHNEMILMVSEKKIIESAEACFHDDVCNGDTVTLGDLIRYGYAKEEVNPITKMYYSHESYVLKKENTYEFFEVLS